MNGVHTNAGTASGSGIIGTALAVASARAAARRAAGQSRTQNRRRRLRESSPSHLCSLSSTAVVQPDSEYSESKFSGKCQCGAGSDVDAHLRSATRIIRACDIVD